MSNCHKPCKNLSSKLVSVNCEPMKNNVPFTQGKLIESIKYIPTKTATHKILRAVTNQCSRWKTKGGEKTSREIKDYIEQYGIDWEEAEKCENSGSVEECAAQFETKNDFFQRHLSPDKIKINLDDKYDETCLISPADCRLVAYKHVHDATKYWIKGKGFTVDKLLGHKVVKGNKLSTSYVDGTLIVCRLAPDDYHRFHFPINCTYMGSYEIKGEYYSVDPKIVNSKIDAFGDNKREVHILYNENFGNVLCVIVAATCTGSIEMDPKLKIGNEYMKGSPFGTFGFGGSTIVMLFPKRFKIRLCKIFLNNSYANVETYIRVGTKLGNSYSN